MENIFLIFWSDVIMRELLEDELFEICIVVFNFFNDEFFFVIWVSLVFSIEDFKVIFLDFFFNILGSIFIN